MNYSFAPAALLLVLVAGPTAAEDYPSHPLKLLVGFSAGGGLDISCRHWAQRLSARLGQQVVVENRPGASGELAVKQAAASLAFKARSRSFVATAASFCAAPTALESSMPGNR